ncbi:hypothetical protein C0991_009057 [Blastosporella zonata]|nr:hypothetical protein C0991_009057 [Blastosporella zonata]
MICELLFPSSILAVKLNRKTLVIVLEVEIYIYDISNMRLLHVIETTKNPDAICALSPSADSSYLAYPSPVPSPTSPLAASSTTSQPPPASIQQQTGDVLLFSTRSLTVANVIQAHKAPISFLSINSTGSLLATASDKGTVIRVWSIPGAEKLYQFRRGTREARIYSISFNLVSTLLAVSSAHDTVHIFKLGPQKATTKPPGQPSSPPESVDSKDSSQGLDTGYDAFLEKKSSNSVSWPPTEIDANDEEPDTFYGWIPAQHINRNVGTFTRFCLPASTNKRSTVHRCFEWDYASRHGDLLRRLLLLVQHRPREWRGVLFDEAV